MKVEKQSLTDLVFTLLIMLMGEEGKDWIYHKVDEEKLNECQS